MRAVVLCAALFVAPLYALTLKVSVRAFSLFSPDGVRSLPPPHTHTTPTETDA